MAWRIVKQPNGLYARFADPVDNFTHCQMTRAEVLRYCIDELGLAQGVEKVLRADAEPERYVKELETIEDIHGKLARLKAEKETGGRKL